MFDRILKLVTLASFPWIAIGDVDSAPRPRLWVTAADRPAILHKIEHAEWARAQFEALKARADEAVARHRADPGAYLAAVDWVPGGPGEHPTLAPIGDNMAATGRASNQTPLHRVLGEAVDCGVLYYLTGDEAYAALGGDVVQAVARAVVRMEPNLAHSNGGVIYTTDHLYEARAVGAQLPIAHDLVATWLAAEGTRVHDLATGGRVPFAHAEAQQAFRTYARLAVEQGMLESNWSVLEMPSLLNNTLALDDPEERAHWLSYVTHVRSPRQEPLTRVLEIFERSGGIWPESMGYSRHVAEFVIYVHGMLVRRGLTAYLPASIDRVALSLPRLLELRLPNGDFARFGDGGRRSGFPGEGLEMAYATALLEGDREAAERVEAHLVPALAQGQYDRTKLGRAAGGAHVYMAPLDLLWFVDEIKVDAETSARPLPFADTLPFAGLHILRDPSGSRDPIDSLAAVVSGAHYIHAHASGMALEIHALGEVLATGAGKGTYTTDEHENYRRLFASYNSVIVDGSSSSDGGWVNLGIDTVKRVGGEPTPGAEPVSPRHAFVATRFTDRQVAGTTAEQERIVVIVRHPSGGGYFADFFRSRSTGPGSFHDYLWHAIGESVLLDDAAGPLDGVEDPERFVPAPGTSWKRNSSYLFPGWHAFKDAKVARSDSPWVRATFRAPGLGKVAAGMRLHLAGGQGREVAVAMAPPTKETHPDYASRPTPVVAVRQQGDAWARPFAVVHEPMSAEASSSTIDTVREILDDGVVAGIRVEGQGPDGPFVHVILATESPEGAAHDAGSGVSLRGRLAVVAFDGDGRVTEAYLGEGTSLQFPGSNLASPGAVPVSGWTTRVGDAWSSPQGGVIISPHKDKN